jgi:hypothetical protein
MLYTIISEDKLKFLGNPLVKEVIPDIIKYKKTEIYLIHTFERAVELHEETDYYSDKIFDNVFWFQDSVEEFSVKHLKTIVDEIKVIPLLSTKDIPVGLFNYENDKLSSFYDETKQTFSVIDKNIATYFNSTIDYPFAINYKTVFRLKLKQLGLVTEIYTLDYLQKYFKQFFKDDYWKYILVVWSLLYKKVDEYVADYEYNGKTYNAWVEMFKVEEYLNNIKIYGVNTRSIDLNFKKDNSGKFFLQYEYSGSENITGRIFTTNLDGYQALQNLPKDDRKVIKAEAGCVLIEIDYKGFEFAILSCLLREEIDGDPHQKTIDNLFPSKKMDRQLGKDINYSVIYGKTVETIARELVEKFPDEEYLVVEKKLKSQDLFSKASIFSSLLRQKNYKKGRMLLKNAFNRWIKVEKDWALLNNFIQSTGADFLYLKFNFVVDLLSKYGPKNKILLQNHDSLLLQLEDKVIDETNLFEEILSIMEEPYEDIKVQIEYKAGRNWGQMD